MFGKVLKKVAKEVKRNVKRTAKSAEKIVKKTGAGSIARKVAGSGKARGFAVAGAAGLGAKMAADRSKMTMGELDKMRAETGQVAAIPREAMAEAKSATEKYTKA